MVIEISTLIIIVSVAIAVITIIYNILRNGKKDTQEVETEDKKPKQILEVVAEKVTFLSSSRSHDANLKKDV